MARRLTALVALVASCAQPGPEVLAPGSVEAALPAVIRPEDPNLVTDVACPAPSESQVAQEMVCTAALDGQPVTVDVTIDETGTVDGAVGEPLFEVASAAEQLARRLADDLDIDPPAVTCERAVVLARAGTEIACVASHAGAPIEFTIRLLDAGGRWTVEIAA